VKDYLIVSAPKKFTGDISVPGDKSVSHRAVLLGSLAHGKTEIYNFLRADDCISTINCMRSLGVVIQDSGECVVIRGKGPLLQPSCRPLYTGNSGTTARLLMGVLAGQRFSAHLTGDESLSRRPMLRVVEPLRLMGAVIDGADGGKKLPLKIRGGELKPIIYELPVASAQVKSAVLLAGLYTEGETSVIENNPSRDHTERILKTFGANISFNDTVKTVKGPASMKGCRIDVPGDISSAAFFLAAAAVLPGSDLTVRGVGINPTRTGIIEVLSNMGTNIEVFNERLMGNEPVGDIRVSGSGNLKGVTVEGQIIPRLIDEIPVIAVAALSAEGITEIKDASELRMKESDRLRALTEELTKMGASIKENADGLIIEGGRPLKGCTCESHGDHRLAMALAVAGMTASGDTIIQGAGCIDISYPSFVHDLKTVTDS
jgi:3-phosphoshikimate 1-carboxyvinyltransferase